MSYSHEQIVNDPNIRQVEDLWVIYQVDFSERGGRMYRDTQCAPILLTYHAGVAIMGEYHHPESWSQGPLDLDGNSTILVPVDRIVRIVSQEEAEVFEQMKDADQKLLSYAR